MKTKFLGMLVVACLMGVQVVNAQSENPQGKKERRRPSFEQMTEMQCNRIVKELALDDKTAAKFTEVYKKYIQEQNELRLSNMPKKADVKKDELRKRKQLTDEEVDQMMRNRFVQARKMLDIREKYYDEFRKFLSPKQVQKVYEQGMANRGKFHKEMNRRSGMKRRMGNPNAFWGNPRPMDIPEGFPQE